MTAPALTTTRDDALAEMTGDVALIALLNTKPADDDVPAAVWWLVAETLRSSVELRRSIAIPGRSADERAVLVADARLLINAALDELAQTAGIHPAVFEAASPHQRGTGSLRSLQLSVLLLARLLVHHGPTSPLRLANTLAAHRSVLEAVAADL